MTARRTWFDALVSNSAASEDLLKMQIINSPAASWHVVVERGL